MAVFHLNSDSYYVCVHCFNGDDSRIYVDEELGDGSWKYIACVGDDGMYTELQVSGVIIRGDELKELAADLSPKNSLTHYSLRVNREGRCFVRSKVVGDYGHGAEIPNTSFNWPKYGLKARTDMELEEKEKELKNLRMQLANKGEELAAAWEREDIRLQSWKLRVEWMEEEVRLYMKRLERKSKGLMELHEELEMKEEETRRLRYQLKDAEEELSQCRKALERKTTAVEEGDKAMEDVQKGMKELTEEIVKIKKMLKMVAEEMNVRMSELESSNGRIEHQIGTMRWD
ncbi:hypothetical protein LINPERHAP2_LOCUS14585 [Linum perenne]